MTTAGSRSHRRQNPAVRAIHTAVKGRRRYKITGLRRSEGLKKYLELRLFTQTGISYARANPLTGNILVLFTAECTPELIAKLLEEIVTEYTKQERKTQKLLSSWGGKAIGPLPSSLSWHLMETDVVLAQLKTSPESGLSQKSVQENLKRYGPNLLPESAPRSGLSIFIDYFKSVPVALLSAAAGLSLATGGLADALVIMGVVLINAILGYATESQSERIIHSLKGLIKPNALVLRDGSLTELGAQFVVRGDILVLRPGSYVAADARLIETNRLSVDESALTGESLPVTKTAEPLTSSDIPLAERVNMVYMGTLVTGGARAGCGGGCGKIYGNGSDSNPGGRDDSAPDSHGATARPCWQPTGPGIWGGLRPCLCRRTPARIWLARDAQDLHLPGGGGGAGRAAYGSDNHSSPWHQKHEEAQGSDPPPRCRRSPGFVAGDLPG